MSTISAFKGINNVTDQLRLGLAWLAVAENVDITDTGAIKKRAGYTKTFSGATTDAYATLDESRCFVVDGGTLKSLTGPTAAVSLLSGLADAPMHFTEINNQVFFSNGVDSGIIEPDNTLLDWGWSMPSAPTLAAGSGMLPAGLYRACCTFILPDGRETGASDFADLVLPEGGALLVSNIAQTPGCTTRLYIAPADSTVFQLALAEAPAATTWSSLPDALGVDLLNDGMEPLPLDATIIQHWRGRIYAAQYLEDAKQTVIWFSQPLGFHLFDVAKDFILIPGRVTMLAPHDSALVIGTDAHIYAYDGAALAVLAEYGVVPGHHWATDDKRILFWSVRGLCAALPFVNLTERQVSVAPGSSAAGALIESGGQKRYVVSLQPGGQAYNPWA